MSVVVYVHVPVDHSATRRLTLPCQRQELEWTPDYTSFLNGTKGNTVAGRKGSISSPFPSPQQPSASQLWSNYFTALDPTILAIFNHSPLLPLSSTHMNRWAWLCADPLFRLLSLEWQWDLLLSHPPLTKCKSAVGREKIRLVCFNFDSLRCLLRGSGFTTLSISVCRLSPSVFVCQLLPHKSSYFACDFFHVGRELTTKNCRKNGIERGKLKMEQKVDLVHAAHQIETHLPINQTGKGLCYLWSRFDHKRKSIWVYFHGVILECFPFLPQNTQCISMRRGSGIESFPGWPTGSKQEGTWRT